MLHAGIVEQEARLEVVRAVEDDLGVLDNPLDVVGRDVRHDGPHLDLGVDPRDRCGCRHRLRGPRGRVRLVEEELPLEIRELDEVAVDDRDAAHAGAGEQVHRDRAERAAADDHDPAAADPLLARRSDPREPGLTGISIALPWDSPRGSPLGGSSRRRSPCDARSSHPSEEVDKTRAPAATAAASTALQGRCRAAGGTRRASRAGAIVIRATAMRGLAPLDVNQSVRRERSTLEDAPSSRGAVTAASIRAVTTDQSAVTRV